MHKNYIGKFWSIIDSSLVNSTVHFELLCIIIQSHYSGASLPPLFSH